MNELLKIAPNLLLTLLLVVLLIRSKKAPNKNITKYLILGLIFTVTAILLELFYFI